MLSAIRSREDYSAEELRTLARRSKEVSQSLRLLSLAAVRDGMDRAAAAKIGGMDRQREHAKSWGACKFLNAKLRAFGKETALWGSWFGG